MYGEIPGPEVEAKSPLVEEGGVYIISRFRVSNAKSGYGPVDARYMVEFTLHTTVTAARDDVVGFPEYAYKITPINELSSHSGDTRNFLGWSTSLHSPFFLFQFFYLMKYCL
jgi:replication factor A1